MKRSKKAGSILLLLLSFMLVCGLLAGCGKKDTDADNQSAGAKKDDNWLELDLGENPVNILDFGAVGDGITDDSQAFQTAIDKVTSSKNGGTVYFPKGIYRMETWIILKSNLTVYMDEDAVILNGINKSDGPSIVFMCGPYDGKNTVEWEGISNITFMGGTIDMNGELNSSQTAPANLPAVVSSTGAFALGYSTDITIKDVTFRDSFNGHALQICNSKNVLIENCEFLGQSFPAANTDSESSQKEYIQIEPSSVAGFPYATNETWEASEYITIKNCHFSASDKCGELMVAIGTHSQRITMVKNNHITIEDSTFDNVAYGAVRFPGWEDVTISGNKFVKLSKRDSTNFRSGTCVILNIFCVNNIVDELDLNKRITIDNNVFEIDDPDTRAIRIGKDKSEYKGEVSDIVITNNQFTNTSNTDTQMLISTIRVKNLTLTGNTLNGGYRGLYVDRCYGDINIANNTAQNLTNESSYIRYTGTNEAVSVFASDDGMIDVSTAGGQYTFSAVAPQGKSFAGFYADSSGGSLISENATVKYAINASKTENLYAQFK